MSSHRRILKNFVVVLFGDVFGRALGMATAIILARYLGPEDYGKYSLVVSLAYIFTIISDFGLNDLIIRDVAQDYTLAPKYIAASFITKPLLSFFSMISLILMVYLMGYPKEIILCTAVFSFHIIFNTLTNSISSAFKGFQRMEYASIVTIVNGIVGLVFVAFLAYWNGTLIEIIFSKVLTLFIGFIVAYLILIKNFGRLDFTIDFPFLKKTLVDAFPFLTIGIIATLFFKIDIIMLSKLKGDMAVGWFSAAANDLFFGLFIIPQAVSSVTYPLFARQYSESIDQLRRSCNFTIKILTIIGVPISAGTFILAPQIINLVFGPEYENSVIVLRIISVGISFGFIRDPFGYGLAAVGKVKILMWLNVFSLIVNVVLNSFMIPLYGHIGAAITSVFCILFGLGQGYYFLNRDIKNLRLFHNYLKPVIAASVMSGVVYLLGEYNIFAVIFVGAVVYTLAIFMLKTFNSSELLVLKKLMKKPQKLSEESVPV